MRLIPGKTKVRVELFKGVSLGDILVGGVFGVLLLLVFISTLPGKLYFVIGTVFLAVLLLLRTDAEPNYLYLLHILRHFSYTRRYGKHRTDGELTAAAEEAAELEARRNSTKAGRLATARAEQLRREREAAEQAAKETAKENEVESESDASEKDPDANDAGNAGNAGNDDISEEAAARREAEEAARREAEEAARREEALARAWRSAIASDKAAKNVTEIMAFTGIRDDMIEYGGKYYGMAIEIPPVEFRFFSPTRRNNAIENALGRVLRSVPVESCANIVKIERPTIYDPYLEQEYAKLEDLRKSYEEGMISEDEMKSRVEVLYDRINDLRTLCYEDKIVQPFYYLVLFGSDRQQLTLNVRAAIDSLRNGEMNPHRLNTKELAVFLKYTNQIDFDERTVDLIPEKNLAAWAMPQSLDIRSRTIHLNHIVTHNMRIVNYPSVVDDAWLAGVMSMPATKVVIKCTPVERNKAVRGIDRSIQELRAQFASTGVDSKRIELQEHIQTLENLLTMLRGDNESLLEVNVYVTCYDIALTRQYGGTLQPPPSCLASISGMKKMVRRIYQEQNLRLNNMEFNQVGAFIGSQVSACDPMLGKGRGIPSNSIAAAFPWVFSHVADQKGIKLGSEGGVPVFIDFFRRDGERVNSNMVIVGKSGSGKSYATKSLLTNLAADDSKIFILDPENEYADLAENLHGKFINVGNAQFGRLNPFHIITSLDDDETGSSTVSGSYATHLQFLEEFFRQILPDCEKDAMEYLNSIIDRMYTNMGITADTDLSRLRPEDYPVFDDLYDAILTEFQSTDNEYIRTMLRTLMNYVAKFSAGGRNANIWNGPSTVTTDENFTVFNFQSLLANRNGTIANAQMLLVLKYIDNEIIKNREYNTKYHLSRKIVVVIDEAHVFIDTKYPVALDFMFQLAKRIRKYNGMQIVITQNIKDFVGSEEIARKSTAIINACQYSFIFSLSPNDIGDLCTLYEKAGGINEQEQEQIVTAPRGQAFIIMSPQSRSTFKVEVPEDVVAMFQEKDYVSRYFRDEDGEAAWNNFMGESREKHDARLAAKPKKEVVEERTDRTHVTFMEVSEEELEAAVTERERKASAAASRTSVHEAAPARETAPVTEDDLDDFPEIPDDPEEFRRMMEERKAATETDNVTETVTVTATDTATDMPEERPTPKNAAPEPQRVIVQAAPASGETERILSELLNKLGSENLREEIRRAIREELDRRVANGELGKTAEARRAGEEKIENNYFGQTVLEEAAKAHADSAETTVNVATASAVAAEEIPAVPEETAFDIMSLLTSEAEKLGILSPIDMMETYGEEIIEITLEELAAYNSKH